MTIAAYDYLVTFPATYRLYKSSNRQSSGLVLFVLIRYTSIIVLVLSNVGFFYRGFTPNSCDHYHLVVPAFKAVQLMASQAILAIRTYNISQRRRWVGRTLLSAYITATVFQWFSSLFSRKPVLIDGNCTSASVHPQRAISTWSFYLVAMLFDFLTLSISAFFLMKVRKLTSSSRALRLVKIILHDGLGYFVALTLMNAANIFLFRGTEHLIQTSGASLGYTVTWIMSQRILIHLHEARVDHKSVGVGRLPTTRAIMSSQLFDDEEVNHKTTDRLDGTLGLPDERGDSESGFVLHVRAERPTVVDGGMTDKKSKEKILMALQNRLGRGL
ncbi:hypothetical protein EI94DRAFT_998546 [Lactarius quietus]|nr:hypothetical protein EI94DRAFT_998546 [Lactarius quietus]